MTTENPTRGRAIEWEDFRLPPWLIGVIGGIGIILLWWILAATVFSNVGPSGASAIPTPFQVVQIMVETGPQYYINNFIAIAKSKDHPIDISDFSFRC